MSDYTKTTDFAAKTSASDVLGAELNAEFNNIVTAIATKTDTQMDFDWQGDAPFIIAGGYGIEIFDLGSITDQETATPNFAVGAINMLQVTGIVGYALFTITNPAGATPGAGPFLLVLTSDNAVAEDTWVFGNKWYYDTDGIGGLGPGDTAFMDVLYISNIDSGAYLATQVRPNSWVAA